MNCRANLRKVFERALPQDARILASDEGPTLILLATWRLTTDPKRPSKRSRLLRIVVSEEALEDYARGSAGVRLASDARFTAWLESRLAHFDPDHQAPLGVEPPAETWELGTLDLNR